MHGRPNDETSPRSTTSSAHGAAPGMWRRRRVALALLGVAAVAGPLYACGSDSGSDTSGTSSGSPTSTSPTGTSPTSMNPTGNPDGSVADGNAPDTGTGVDAAPDPAAAVLALGPRVVLWLDADQGYASSGAGIVWKDRSASKNDAVQTTAAQDPGYLDAGVDGSVNGHGVVHFGGSAFLTVADTASLHWSAGDYALYVAVRQTVPDPASSAIIYGKFAEIVPFSGPMLWANYPYGPDGNGPGVTGYATRLDNSFPRTTETDGGMNDGVMRLVGVHKSGNALELRVGGTAVSTAADVSGFDTSGFDSTGRPVFIGGRPELNQMLLGDIAALIAVKGSITDPEQAGVETYLKTKFGL